MALVLADRVVEQTTTNGTGTLTLTGAVSKYQSFAVIGNGNTTYYTIVHQTLNQWEVGIGTYTAVGTTLSRDTVLASSNANALVNFGGGSKYVFADYPAGKAVYQDASGNVTVAGTATFGSFIPTSSTLPTNGMYLPTGNTLGWAVAGAEGMRLGTNGLLIGTASVVTGSKLVVSSADATINGLTVGRGNGSQIFNAAFGINALSVTSGNQNSAFGYQTLLQNTTGQNNCAFGSFSLQANTSGSNNIGIGVDALYNNTSASSCVGIGTNALFYNTTNSLNTAVGAGSCQNSSSTVGAFGTIVGGSGYTNGTYTNVQLTYSSGSTVASGGSYPIANITVSGGAVTAVTLVNGGKGFKDGTTILTAPSSSIGGTGSGFTVAVSALGGASGLAAFGFNSLFANVSGSNNSAFGFNALTSNVAGNFNTAIGYNALYYSTSSSNTGVGYLALAGSTFTGSNNIAIGTGSGNAITTGSYNTILGSYNGNQGGLDIRTASSYIVLSDGVGNPRWIVDTNGTAGYGPTTGGTVTQATSRTTGVTLNKPTGAITLVSAAGTTAWQSFTVTNSAVAATDTVIVNQKSGTDLYQIFVTNVAAGSFRITFATTGGTTTEQPVFNFAVIKGQTV